MTSIRADMLMKLVESDLDYLLRLEPQRPCYRQLDRSIRELFEAIRETELRKEMRALERKDRRKLGR